MGGRRSFIGRGHLQRPAHGIDCGCSVSAPPAASKLTRRHPPHPAAGVAVRGVRRASILRIASPMMQSQLVEWSWIWSRELDCATFVLPVVLACLFLPTIYTVRSEEVPLWCYVSGLVGSKRLCERVRYCRRHAIGYTHACDGRKPGNFAAAVFANGCAGVFLWVDAGAARACG
eukprot:SAG11_NODE_7193_length_1180_cov_1.836263_2_plen_174_part_00